MPTFRVEFQAMASTCEIIVAAADAVAAQAWSRRAMEEVWRIEHKYSRYRDDSVVARINTAAGSDWVACDAETLALFDYAGKLYVTSDGLFDITSGVLRRAWNFRQPQVPSEDAVDRLRALIGWPRVERDGARIRLPRQGMEIDFGGFGKEYAADRAADTLAASGACHGYVNLAGDMRFVGARPDGQPWQIGIQHPRAREALVATLPMTQGALATSGDYERYFELEGRRYCHVLHPATGWPVTHWRSVSVKAPLAIVAGGLATIAMLKEQGALEFLDQAGVDYLAIDHTGAAYRNGDQHPSGGTFIERDDSLG